MELLLAQARTLCLALVAVLCWVGFACALAPARPWYQNLDFTATRHKLERMRIKRIRSLRQFLEDEKHIKWEGSNELFLIELADGTRAVFRTEERPWGSTAEVSGYRFARYLGSRLVPPTTRRTLHRGAGAGIPGWAWKTPSRLGSLQLFIDAKGEPLALPLMSEKERADVEVISFVFGRYDNHSGNLLLDAAGAPVMIDFEGSMNLQKVRYGEVPYVVHGGRFHSPDSVPRSQPFPFDAPKKLVNPTLEQVQTTFGPWWNQLWPSGMVMCHKMTADVPDHIIRYVIWDDRLWVQMNMPRRHPCYTNVYSKRTLDRLKLLSRRALRAKLLTEQYAPEHIEGFLERRRLLLDAARTGRIIP